MINVYGIFDNLAWAFLLQHNLITKVGSVTNIGLFTVQTQKYLPSQLKKYLDSEDVSTWHKTYIKDCRDTLAHRIPIYVPPSAMTEEEIKQYNFLQTEEFECIKSGQFDKLKEIRSQKENIGSPCFMFLYKTSDNTSQHNVYLHPQLLSDSNTVIKITEIFLATWQEHD